MSLGLKIVHVHHSEKHLMGQIVCTFLAKNNTNCFVTIKSDFVFCSIVTTNIQKTLQPVSTGAEHTYIISITLDDSQPYFPQCIPPWLIPAG